MIHLAFSPCPNDTFIFDAIVNQKIDLENLEFSHELHDVETLNAMAMKGMADMIKVSYHAYLYLQKGYVLFDSGSALGKGNGPLLISRRPIEKQELAHCMVAIPGEYTTAHLLLKVAYPTITNKKIMHFSEIEEAVLSGKVDAGVIIHENRFTYAEKGLTLLSDLGVHWEREIGMPLPLGGIIGRRSLGYDTINSLNRVMYRSVEFAMKHPAEAMPFVRAHAQEMDEAVMEKHIRLYVNDYTLSMGTGGRVALAKFIGVAGQCGIPG